MKFVVDANVLFSALIADSTTRELLIELDHQYLAPQFVHTEIRNHRSTIEDKSNVSSSTVDALLDALFDELALINDSDLKPYMDTAYAAIGDDDEDDVPYLAAALATNAAVWSDDSVFEKQSTVEAYTTERMVSEFELP